MPSSDRLRHVPVALAVVLGAGLLGASVGDIARMDSELRAATPVVQPAGAHLVVQRGPVPRAHPVCNDGPRPRPWRSREV